MAADRAFRLSVYVVVALGGLALGAGDLLTPVMLALFLAGLIGTWWLRDGLGSRAWLSQRGDIVATLSLTGLAVADLLWFADSFLDTFARLVCALLLVRLATWRVTRELRAAGFLSFSMLAAASAVAFGVAFLPLFLTYLATAIVMLVLFHLVTEAEAAGVAPRPLGVGLTIVMGGAVAGTLAITALLFAIIPRVEAALPLGARSSRALTGFTDRVELGAFGTLETDDTVAMRVRLPDGPVAPRDIPRLRWRGITLDQFDGRIWTSSPRRHVVLRASDGVPVWLGRVEGPGRVLTQDVFLEPLGSETLFAAPAAMRVAIDGAVRIDDSGGLSLPVARARTTYTVASALGANIVERLGPLARARYLQRPRLPPRIPELAERITEGAATPGERARRLTAWLSRELRYSLDLERRTNLEPLDEFLFVRRAGNCEYFAAALAVMLRTLDVPARVVNGFQRGEWNPYGNYWVVRMRDAHSWVEAHVDGAWITLDPSPRGEMPAATLTNLTLYLDGLRMRWYRYVVGWSRQDQAAAAGAVRRFAWSLPTPRLPAAKMSRPVMIGIALGLAAAAALLWLIQQAWATRAAPRAAIPDFYAQALKRLERRGLRPGTGETGREFCARLALDVPDTVPALSRLTQAYEDARFGDRAPTAVDHRALLEIAARL